MSACNCCSEPPVSLWFWAEYGGGSYKDESKTEAEVIAEAQSIIAAASYSGGTAVAWPTYLAAEFYWDSEYGGAGGSKGRFRIRHNPTPSCYLKVWLREIYTPDVGSETTTSLTPYEWIGDGPVCLTDTTKAVDDAANEIESDWYYVDCPAAYGQKNIVGKYSFIPGYEPAWP